jgi:hypothetical protein
VIRFSPCPAAPPIPRRRGAAIATVAALLVSGGCGREADIRPGDIRTYTIPRDAEPPPVVAAPPETPAAAAGLTFDVPDGWSDAGASGMRLTTLLIGDPADKREVTVISASGTLEGNVDRWQGQLDPEATADERAAAVAKALTDAEKVDVGGTPANVVTLTDASGRQAILGAMIPRGDASALFVKFKGDAAVAKAEREKFVRFVASIRWKQSP